MEKSGEIQGWGGRRAHGRRNRGLWWGWGQLLQFSKFHMQFDIQYMRSTCVILRHRYIVKDILHHICCVCKLYSPGSVHLASGLGLTWTKIQAIMIQAMDLN